MSLKAFNLSSVHCNRFGQRAPTISVSGAALLEKVTDKAMVKASHTQKRAKVLACLRHHTLFQHLKFLHLWSHHTLANDITQVFSLLFSYSTLIGVDSEAGPLKTL